MDTQEIDSTLDELESRLDRLRALYEQYFLGIEKIEPAVARKDVDRRFWMLRRVQIRNTARRWRLQVLIQRYNTFQQYWTRICREIENGTYVRHLLKAKKNLGAEPKTWAAKKRMGLLRRDRVGDAASAAPEGASEAVVDASAQLDGGLGSTDDLGEAKLDPTGATRNGGQPPPRASRPKAGTVTLTLDDLGPLDLDFDDEPTPPPRAAAKPPSATPGPPRPPGLAAAAAAAAKVTVARPPAVASPRPASPAPPAPPAPPGSSVGVPGRPTAPKSPAGVGDARPRPPPSAASTAGPAAAKAPPFPAAAAAVARPPAAAPSPNAAAVARPPAAAPGAASPTLLSEDRVRTLHAELVAARRQLNQGDNVSMDSLAKSLRETEKKLRAQHAGRSVDFQIVVKDGKPVVKPVVRK